MDPQQLDQVQQLGDELAECEADLDVASHYNSASLSKLRGLFLSDPAGARLDGHELEYRQPDEAGLARLASLLDRAAAVEHPTVADMLSRMIETSLRYAAAIMSHDPGDITNASLSTYGQVPDDVLLRAFEVLQDSGADGAEEEPSISAELAAAELDAELARLGLEQWTVEVRPEMHARMSVSSARQRVFVRAGVEFTRAAVQRLIVHEIGTHVLRAVNGSRNPLSFLRLGLPGYQATEEGLAVFHESAAGLMSEADLRRYALRVIAVDRSLSAGADEVLEELMDYTSPEVAFEIAMRVKRGFTRAGLPGADVKDQVYLRGMLAVSDHLESQPDDWRLLMVGKIGLGDLDSIRALMVEGLVAEQSLLPNL